MRIGIISGHKGEKKFGFRVYKTDKISDETNPFNAAIICLPYSLDELSKIKSCRRLRIFKKAVDKLKKNDVNCIILTEDIREYRTEIAKTCKTVRIPDGREVFYKFIPDAVEAVSKRCGIKPLDAKVCITARRTDRITAYLLSELCYKIRNLTICTDEKEIAENICVKFSEETGFFPKVTDISQNTMIKADILIDMDKYYVRIGRNVIVDGVNFDFKLNGYSVNMLDIAGCLEDFDLSGRVISYNCGKNKLTL